MRPSSLALSSHCPKSFKLNKGYGSEQSQIGSIFHELARRKILNEPLNFEELQLRYGLTEEQIRNLRYGINNLEIDIPEGVIIHAEEKLQSKSMNIEGTPDVWLDKTPIGENVAILIDFKNGRAEIEPPEKNLQVLCYAILIFENNPHIERIEIAIMQTLLKQVKQYSLDRENAIPIQKIISDIIDAAENDDAQFVNGPWCMYCYSNLNCFVFAQQYRTLSNQIVPKPDGINLAEHSLQEALCVLLPIAKRASTVGKQLEDLAKVWVDRNGTLELGNGTVYAKTSSVKKKLDTGKAMPVLQHYFDLEGLCSLVKLSNSQVQKLARTKERGMAKEINNALEAAGAFIEEETITYKILKQGVIEDDGGE